MIVENQNGWQALVSFDEEQDLLGLVAELDHVAMNNPERPFLSSLRRQLYLVFEDELHAAPEREEEEPSEPDEEDGVIEFLRGKYSVGLGRSHLGDYLTDHEARYWLAREMDQVQFWPNAWMISDHGNAHLIVLDKAVPLESDSDFGSLRHLRDGTNVTVTYERDRERDTVSGFVDWAYVAIAEGLEDGERDGTIAVIAGTTGPRFLIHFDNLLAITVADQEEGGS